MRQLLLGLLACSGTLAAGERIVVAGGALTEIVYALGAGEQVVGVDTTSSYLPQVAHLPNIGYLRALSAEGVIALRPDWFLTTPDAGPPEVLVKLRRAGVRIEIK